MTALFVGLLLLAVALVVLFAVFEVAFFASGPIAVRALGSEGEQARALRERLADPLAVLIPARFGLLVAAGLVVVALAGLGFGLTPGWWIPGVFLPAWFLVREVAPAAILLRDSEEVLRGLLPWFRGCERIARPGSEALRRLLRRAVPLVEEAGDDASEEEVEAFLETGEEEGILEEEEAAMVRGVLDLDEMLVREVMTARPHVVSVPGGASRAEVERLISTSRHHRIPVFGNQDQVIGVVDAVDLVAAPPATGEPEPPLRKLPLRRVPVVPETKRVDDLLREFKLAKETFAVVVDEHASVSGIVTLRDISGEIVGEVREDGGPEEADLVAEGEGSWVVRGEAELAEVSRATGLDLPDSLDGAAFDTVCGLVLAAWQRIPEVGEVIERDRVAFEILEADERRVHRVRLRRAPRPAGPATG